jgi:hypothetical protein
MPNLGRQSPLPLDLGISPFPLLLCRRVDATLVLSSSKAPSATRSCTPLPHTAVVDSGDDNIRKLEQSPEAAHPSLRGFRISQAVGMAGSTRQIVSSLFWYVSGVEN